MKNLIRGFAALAAGWCVASAQAGLVARWDFDAFDAENPTSAAILAPTIGSQPVVACTGNGSSTPIADGTLGAITVVEGGHAGDYALSIPSGAHLKIPFPSADWATAHTWMVRICFCSPVASDKQVRALIQPDLANAGNTFIWIDAGNYIYGNESIFGNAAEENKLGSGTLATRTVTTGAWSTYALYLAPNGVTTTLNGVRTLSTSNTSDRRALFAGDGFLLCAAKDASDRLLQVSAVELWEDVPVHHINAGYLGNSPVAQTFAAGTTLTDIRDLYISARHLGGWAGTAYAASLCAFDRIVTSNADGTVGDLKFEMRTIGGDQVTRAHFVQDGTDIKGSTYQMCYGRGWPNWYFTDNGENMPNGNYQAAVTTYNGGGYAAYNLYAIDLLPLTSDLGWRFFMGCGHFGHPIISVVGDRTLTFDYAPSVDDLTFDCGSGSGAASVTFALGIGIGKNFSALQNLNVRTGVTVVVPDGLQIAGVATFEPGARLSVVADTAIPGSNVPVFTAPGGIVFPEGAELADLVTMPGYELSFNAEHTQILATGQQNIPVTATWIGSDVTAVEDSANWDCRNIFGSKIPDIVPDNRTVVTIAGATTFNVPTGHVFTCRSIAFNAASLAADCDWRGLAYPLSGTIDLNGHRLQVANLAGTATITDSIEDAAGTLELDVPNDDEVQNVAVALTGHLRFVKRGVGTLTAARASQTYDGGTEIVEGAILLATAAFPLGPLNAMVKVGAGATLDMNGCYSQTQCVYTYDLAGTVRQKGGSSNYWDDGAKCFGDISLSGDAVIEGNGFFFANATKTPGFIAFNGHRLTISKTSGWTIGIGAWRNAEGDVGGTFVMEGPEAFETLVKDSGTILTTCQFTGGHLQLKNTYEVGGFSYTPQDANCAWSSNTGTPRVKVFGTYTPGPDRPPLILQHGASIDLTQETEPFSVDGVAPVNVKVGVNSNFTDPGAVMFADGATIFLKVSSRKTGKVLSWTTPPDNIKTVRFTCGDEPRCSVYCQDDGVYIQRGMWVIVR